MNVEYEGKGYIFDLEDMDTDDAAVMEAAGIPNLKALGERLVSGERIALQFTFWLMQKQGGAKTRFEAVQFKPLRFIRALDEATPVVDVESGPKDPNPSDRKRKGS